MKNIILLLTGLLFFVPAHLNAQIIDNAINDPGDIAFVAYNESSTGGEDGFSFLLIDSALAGVNDAPVVNLNGQGTNFWTEGNAPTLLYPSILISDPDGDNITKATISMLIFVPGDVLNVTSPGPYSASYNSGTGVLTLSGTGTAAQMQAALRTVGFRNSTDNPGVGNIQNTRVRTIFIEDENLATSAAVTNIGIFITSVNDDPTISALPTDITVQENIGSNVNLSAAVFTDVDAGAYNITLTLSVSTGTLSASDVAGVTVGGSGTATIILTGTATAIDTYLNTASNITYTGPAALVGNNAATLTLTANDGGNTGTGGGSDVVLGTVNIDIAGVNNDPTFTGLPASVTVVEDAVIAYLSNALSDATFADVDAGNNDVTLILSVSAGTLNFANPQGVITITGFGTPTAYLVGTVANIETYLSTNTNAAYFPPLNLSGANSATLTVSANDNGHTGIGGGTDVVLGSFIININAINDAPTVTAPATISATQDVSSSLTGISFIDVDAGTGSVTISLTVGQGILSATAGGGVTVSGNGSTALTLEGSLTAINVFFSDGNVSFTNQLGITADQTLTVTINDNGNTGSGGNLSSSDDVIISLILGTPVVTSITVPANGTYVAGQQMDFVSNFDENVLVNTAGGTPSLSLVVGSSSVQAEYLSGSGSGTLMFRYTVQAGDEDNNGISVGTISLNGGTMQSASGNNADLTLNNVGNTSAVLVDAVAPAGYTVQIDQDLIDKVNQNGVSFTFSGAEPGTTFNYTFSGVGAVVNGSGTIGSASDQIAGINLSGLADGTITLSVTLTDPAGNTGSPVSDIATKNTNSAPTVSGVSISGIMTVGEVLTGNYTYTDADADTESGSTFQWYSSADALGTGKIVISGADTEQYTLQTADRGVYISFEVVPNDGTLFGVAVESAPEGPVKINQTISFSSIPIKTYGDVPFTLGDAQTDQGLDVIYAAVDPTVVSITGNQTTILKSGSTLIIATQVGDGQTNMATQVSQNLTVTAATLDVIADAGQSKDYGAIDPVFTYTAANFSNGDTEAILTGSLTRIAGEDVGTYVINVGTLSAGGNYTLNFVPANLVIGKTILTITAENKEKFAGTANPPLTIKYAGFVGNETAEVLDKIPSINTSATASSPAGDYPIIVSGAVASNYDIKYINGILKVKPGAPNNITLESTTVYENGPAKTKAGTFNSVSDDPSATYTYSLVSGTGDTDNALFSIEDKSLFTKSTLDFERKSTYTIRVKTTTQYGLSLEKVLTVTISDVNEAPTLAAISNSTVCYTAASQTIPLSGISAGPEKDQSVTLDVKSDNPALFRNLKVSGSGNEVSISYAIKNEMGGTANITVTVTDDGGVANGGVNTYYRTFVLTVNPLPAITITSDKGSDISKGDIVQLTASGAASYVWTANSSIISGQHTATLTVRPTENTTYEVVGTNTTRCSEKQSFSIKVVEDFKLIANNIVTPNGDGYNDKWIVENIDIYPDNLIKVFDRAGRLIYSKKGYDNSWDATYNGTPLNEGTYYYVMEFTGSSRKFKGYITVVREN